MPFDLALTTQPSLRLAIDALYRKPEQECVQPLADLANESPQFRLRVRQDATRLVLAVRAKRTRAGGVDALMREFSLSSEEGVALMCLAEALLRIPDSGTRDALIRDKIGGADWHAHLGRSPSLFVNAASWGLLITGTLVATHSATGLSTALARLIGRGGEPLIRKGVDLAMRMLGRQFVTGETIESAIENGAAYRARGYRYSYDMLGEGAVTANDAKRYFEAYEKAIHAIGAHARSLHLAAEEQVRLGPGISVKLSALHPRYARSQRERVQQELLPRLKALALLALSYNIGLNIDAEESERLDLSLDLVEALAGDPELGTWKGLGFVVQAYQKRAPAVIDFLIDLARRTQFETARRIMIRLVKGAYWDSEIKRAQVEGQADYPVYTRKLHTDVAYQACAKKLLGATDVIYPQFATHNAYTLAWVRECARTAGVREAQFEFQCLHGMGETLYDQVVGQTDAPELACRIYAPVGSHETLLAYLVRRLLENGANSSFVNRIVDEKVSIAALVEDPVVGVQVTRGQAHSAIALPRDLYPNGRVNSEGFDWSSETELHRLAQALDPFAKRQWQAAPTFMSEGLVDLAPRTALVRNPASRAEVVGEVVSAGPDDVARALQKAQAAIATWASVTHKSRAELLLGCARNLEAHRVELIALLVREAGKSLPNALGEVREAVDFCRYYAQQLESEPGATGVAGPALVCISPWNFPLAIFVGQVVGALASGRVVLAKPAEQTPLVASVAVRLFHEAGIAREVLQLLPGDGASVGAVLVGAAAIGGVLFTGSTEVARSIARTLAKAPEEQILVAETGGENAMLVDSSALTEQVVQDIISSAFDSAGQRCSALRVLCVQEDVAETTLRMLTGAMGELSVGNPARLAHDIGPVIDDVALSRLKDYVAAMRARGHRVTQIGLAETCGEGTFMPPTIIEIDQFSDLSGEVFGPVLHVMRYRFGQVDSVIDAINRTGYGLTMGVHSRIDEHIQAVATRARVGNLYVNRNMVGAVVGVQPFGGEGLSGTGPKAGGPLYLARLGGPLGRELRGLMDLDVPERAASNARARLSDFQVALRALKDFTPAERAAAIARSEAAWQTSLIRRRCLLPGPTGETNLLWFSPRSAIACVAETALELADAIGIVVACGAIPFAEPSLLPPALRIWVKPLSELQAPDAVLVSEGLSRVTDWRVRMASGSGPIVPVIGWSSQTALESIVARLFHERTISTNTAAAGGNASLMVLTD